MEEREVIELLRHSPIMDEAKKYKKEKRKREKEKKCSVKKYYKSNRIQPNRIKKKFPTFFTMFTSSEMF